MGSSKILVAMKNYEETRREYDKKHFQKVAQPTEALRLNTELTAVTGEELASALSSHLSFYNQPTTSILSPHP